MFGCTFPRSREARVSCPPVLIVVLAALYLIAAFTPSKTAAEAAKARYSNSQIKESLRFTPVTLRGGSRLTLISPERWATVAEELSDTVKETHKRYANLFQEIPPVTTAIRLMDEQSFFETTGAPSWTNALYLRGQIIIPLSTSQPVDTDNLRRSVRHEYTHAVINALSGGRCPCWLDEGIAQWSEGSENPALEPALRKWLVRQDPVPLGILQGGFTKLSASMVPAAYAQSLFAANSVMNSFGFEKLSKFMETLRGGEDHGDAFQESFGVSEKQFEQRLGVDLIKWAGHEAQVVRMK